MGLILGVSRWTVLRIEGTRRWPHHCPKPVVVQLLRGYVTRPEIAERLAMNGVANPFFPDFSQFPSPLAAMAVSR